MNVRLFKGRERIIGKYADIKGEISAIGGKFCKSVYAALIKNDQLELVNFQLKGISFKAWMDAVIDKSSFSVKVSTCIDGKKGKVAYKIPVYEQSEVGNVLIEKAVLMDKELQHYLIEYFNQQVQKEESQKDDSIQKLPSVEDDDMPF